MPCWTMLLCAADPRQPHVSRLFRTYVCMYLVYLAYGSTSGLYSSVPTLELRIWCVTVHKSEYLFWTNYPSFIAHAYVLRLKNSWHWLNRWQRGLYRFISGKQSEDRQLVCGGDILDVGMYVCMYVCMYVIRAWAKQSERPPISLQVALNDFGITCEACTWG